MRSRPFVSVAALCCGLLLAAPVLAGMTVTTVTSASGANAEMQAMTADAWVSGDKLKVEIRESGNPIMGKGMWLVTTDGGKTMHLYNPKEKTCSDFDPAAMLGGAMSMMKAMGPMAKMSFGKPQIEKLMEEPGPEIHGLSTTHYKYRTTYSMSMQVLMMKMASTSETVEETWATEELAADAGMGAWMRKGFKTGDPDIDALITAEMEKVKGWPLKRIAVTTTTDDKGKKSTTTTTTEVTALDRSVSVPDSTFVLPPCEEVPLMPAGMPFGQQQR